MPRVNQPGVNLKWALVFAAIAAGVMITIGWRDFKRGFDQGFKDGSSPAQTSASGK